MKEVLACFEARSIELARHIQDKPCPFFWFGPDNIFIGSKTNLSSSPHHARLVNA